VSFDAAERAEKTLVTGGTALGGRCGPSLRDGDGKILFTTGLASKRLRFESGDYAGGSNRVLIHKRGYAVQPIDRERTE
jgi:hypothetical protein